ncbi:MAG: AIR synthase-related protein [Candidatus Hadarchaeales archaeon]
MGSRYAEVGVDVKKRGVEGFRRLIENAFPLAFCPVLRDPISKNRGIVLHTDGAGSKPVQSYLQWRETGETAWFLGLAQDVVAMNLDDVICVGASDANLVDYLAINPFRVPKETVLKEIGRGFRKCLSLLRRFGMRLHFLGGETADLPDQVRTLDVSGTISASVDLSKIVGGDGIRPGDLIVGLRSGGKTKYERAENSGIMCNGITLARHCLMKAEYCKKYPEIAGDVGRGYYGRYGPDEYVDELHMTAGEAILSPTRIFAPVVVEVLRKVGKGVSGLVHNTGGGLTKCLRLGKRISYVKDDLFEPDPIFLLIQRESKVDWREMYEDFNMGVGFEIVVREQFADEVLSTAERFGLGAKVIGRCEKGKARNTLTVKSEHGKFVYW